MKRGSKKGSGHPDPQIRKKIKDFASKLNKLSVPAKRSVVGDVLHPKVLVQMRGSRGKTLDITYRLLKNQNSESQYLARLVYDDEYRKKKVAELVVYFTKKGREMKKKVEKKKVEKAADDETATSLPQVTAQQMEKMTPQERVETLKKQLWKLVVNKEMQSKFSKRGIQEILMSIIKQHNTIEKQMKLLTNSKWRKRQIKWWSRQSQWEGLTLNQQKKMARDYVYPKFQKLIEGDEAEKIYVFVVSNHPHAHHMIRLLTDPEYLKNRIEWARRGIEANMQKKMEEEKLKKQKMEEERKRKQEEAKKRKMKEEEEKKKKKSEEEEESVSNLYLEKNTAEKKELPRRREPVPLPRGRGRESSDNWNVVRGGGNNNNNNTPSRFENRENRDSARKSGSARKGGDFSRTQSSSSSTSAERYANRNNKDHRYKPKPSDPEAQIYRLLENGDDVRKLQNIWNGCTVSQRNQLKKVTAINSARFGRTKCCVWILDRGADPNTSTKKRSTLLHYSAYLGQYELVDALLKRGAATNIRNTDYNETAEETAMSQTHIKCAKLIRNNPNVLRKRGNRRDNNRNTNRKGRKRDNKRGGKSRRGRRRNDLELMRSLPLLSEDVLKQSSNAWSKRNKEEATWEDKLRSLLNKINAKETKPELYAKNLDKIMNDFPITESLENFESLVDSIFAAAIRMPTFANTFANLCDDLNARLSDVVQKKDLVSCEKDEDGGFLAVVFGEKLDDSEYDDREEAMQAAKDLCDFAKRIKDKCQEEFEMGIELEEEQLPKEILDLPEADINRRRAVIRLEQRQNKLKDMIHGNLGFMGELFKLGMIPSWGIHGCIGHLLQKPNKDNILCLKKLLVTVGSTLDRAGEKKRVDKHMTKINSMIKNHSEGTEKLESQAYFALKDIVDLRQKRWGDTSSSAPRSKSRRDDARSSKGGRDRRHNDRRSRGGEYDDRRHGGGGYDNRDRRGQRGGYDDNRRNRGDRRGGYNDRRQDDRFSRNRRNDDRYNNRFSSSRSGQSQDFRRQSSSRGGGDDRSRGSQNFRRTTSGSSSYSRDDESRRPRIRFQDQQESKSNNLTRDKVKRRVTNTLRELVSNADDVNGAMESLKDLKMSGQDEMEILAVNEIFDFAFQTKAQDEESRNKIRDFFNALKSNKVISAQNVAAAIKSLEEVMDDIKIDCPKAPEYFKAILSSSSSSSSSSGETTTSSLSADEKSKIRRRVENAAKELASGASNVNDSTLDVKELKGIERDLAQSFSVQVLIEWYIQSSPGKDKDGREKVCELLRNLIKENVVTKSNARVASDEIKSLLPDVKIDCPMAPKYFDEVVKALE